MAEIFLALEPLGDRRFVEIKEPRKAVDGAHFVERLVDVEYPDAETIVLVEDNPNIHSSAPLYEAFPPEKARRIASRLEMHFTTKHDSWLDIAEIELSAYKRQCIPRRIDDIEKLRRLPKACCEDRNTRQTKVDWQFTAEDARIKLKRLYPKIQEGPCTRAAPFHSSPSGMLPMDQGRGRGAPPAAAAAKVSTSLA